MLRPIYNENYNITGLEIKLETSRGPRIRNHRKSGSPFTNMGVAQICIKCDKKAFFRLSLLAIANEEKKMKERERQRK